VSRLLIDSMVWNYVAKSCVLDGFLNSLADPPVTLTFVLGQLTKATDNWPELMDVLAASKEMRIETAEPTEDEQQLLSLILSRHSGLGAVDCALLAVAKTRGWSLVTCDGRLAKAASTLGIVLVTLDDLLSCAIARGSLSSADCDWIGYYCKGGIQHRLGTALNRMT